jgi:branched-chain amino acid transport system permease protein
MVIFFQQILNGIIMGSIYALVALGLTMIFGILHIANFAHGALYMLGAYFTHFFMTSMGIGYWIAIPCSMISTALVGIIVDRFGFNLVRNAPHSHGFIVALGMLIFLENVVVLIWGPDTRVIESPADSVYNVFGLYITSQRLLIIILTIFFIGVLYLFLQRNRWGKAIRAIAQDREAALAVGINVNRVSSFTFALGSALAAAAGSLIGPLFSLDPFMGTVPVLKAFVVIILGGLGSIPGSIVGGYILGVAESLGGGYISTKYQDTFAFIALIFVLLIRPTGLMGKE